jgi:hypothetical protein
MRIKPTEHCVVEWGEDWVDDNEVESLLQVLLSNACPTMTNANYINRVGLIVQSITSLCNYNYSYYTKRKLTVSTKQYNIACVIGTPRTHRSSSKLRYHDCGILEYRHRPSYKTNMRCGIGFGFVYYYATVESHRTRFFWHKNTAT